MKPARLQSVEVPGDLQFATRMAGADMPTGARLDVTSHGARRRSSSSNVPRVAVRTRLA